MCKWVTQWMLCPICYCLGFRLRGGCEWFQIKVIYCCGNIMPCFRNRQTDFTFKCDLWLNEIWPYYKSCWLMFWLCLFCFYGVWCSFSPAYRCGETFQILSFPDQSHIHSFTSLVPLPLCFLGHPPFCLYLSYEQPRSLNPVAGSLAYTFF